MGEVGRLKVRKIYASRAMLFGLLYGFIFGIIEAIVIFVSYLVFGSALSSLSGLGVGVPIISSTAVLIFAFLNLLASAILMSLSAGIFALIYNLVSALGGSIHMDLEEQTVGNITISQ